MTDITNLLINPCELLLSYSDSATSDELKIEQYCDAAQLTSLSHACAF